MKKNNSKFMSLREFEAEFIPDKFIKNNDQNLLKLLDPIQQGKIIVNEVRKKIINCLKIK